MREFAHEAISAATRDAVGYKRLSKVAPVLRLDGGDGKDHRHDEEEDHLQECGDHGGKLRLDSSFVRGEELR